MTDPRADPDTPHDAPTVHMQKLAVGIGDVEALRRRVAQRLAGRDGRHVVLTRMMPVRHEALAAGGSLYWVIAGQIRARQRILRMEAFGGSKGSSKGSGKTSAKGGPKAKRCRITLDPEVVETECAARRPFQGWRYLAPGEAPRDLTVLAPLDGLDAAMHRELAELGLL